MSYLKEKISELTGYAKAYLYIQTGAVQKQTKYIINESRINLMKRGVMLINTSRGGLVNTKDVIKGLKSCQIGYLGLDVYEEEKGLFFEDHLTEILQDDVIARLMTFPNVVITSHQAFMTDTTLWNIASTTISNLDFKEERRLPVHCNALDSNSFW